LACQFGLWGFCCGTNRRGCRGGGVGVWVVERHRLGAGAASGCDLVVRVCGHAPLAGLRDRVPGPDLHGMVPPWLVAVRPAAAARPVPVLRPRPPLDRRALRRVWMDRD